MDNNHAFVVKLNFSNRVHHYFVDSRGVAQIILETLREAIKSNYGSYLFDSTLYSLEGFDSAIIIEKGTSMTDAEWLG